MEFFTNPWVIGIGTGVIVGLILYFVFGIGKPKSRRAQPTTQSTTQLTTTIQEKNHSTPPLVPAQEVTSDITPQNIKKYLDSLPPLQRDSAAENYKGIKVSWKVNLHSVTTLSGRSGTELQLHMYHHGNLLSPQVTCTVQDPNQYPMLRVIKGTQLFTVEGEIKEITSIAIRLKNCRLFF